MLSNPHVGPWMKRLLGKYDLGSFLQDFIIEKGVVVVMEAIKVLVKGETCWSTKCWSHVKYFAPATQGVVLTNSVAALTQLEMHVMWPHHRPTQSDAHMPLEWFQEPAFEQALLLVLMLLQFK